MKLCVLENLYAALPFEESLKKLHASRNRALAPSLGCCVISRGKAAPSTAEIPAVTMRRSMSRFLAPLDKYRACTSPLSALTEITFTPTRRLPRLTTRTSATPSCSQRRWALIPLLPSRAAPATARASKHPNWVTCPWPDDFPADPRNASGNEDLIPLLEGSGSRSHRQSRRTRIRV